MKKILFILIACLLASCNDANQARSELINRNKENNPYLGRFMQYDTGTNVDIVVDTQTGCEYITNYHGGIQPIGDCKGKKQP